MKQAVSLAFMLMVFVVPGLVRIPIPAEAQQPAPSELVDLAPGTDWGALFEAGTGASADGSHFGAYVFAPRGEELFIGLGAARPAEQDGALVAAFDGAQARAVGRLGEQGINEIVTDPFGTLIIGGADPSYGDGWDMGNAYTSTGAGIRKQRESAGLLNVIHMWALEAASDGRTYAAVSSHDGSFPGICNYDVNCFGEIFSSSDGGATWSRLSRLGAYRAYDIKEFKGDLYALYTDTHGGAARLAVSQDQGSSWKRISLPAEDGRRTHLVQMGDRLVMLGGGSWADRLYSISGPDSGAETHLLPFAVGTLDFDATHFSQYNLFAVVGQDLYTLSRDGRVMRSSDLMRWEPAAESGRENALISIGYWPATNQILVGERGPGAGILAFGPGLTISNNNVGTGNPGSPDTDGDGVPDDEDVCPTTAAGASVISFGSTAGCSATEGLQNVMDGLKAITRNHRRTQAADQAKDALASVRRAHNELKKTKADHPAAAGALGAAAGDIEAAFDFGPDSAAADELLDCLTGVAGIARLLATDAIDAAMAAGGDMDAIDGAQRSLDEGDSMRSSGDYKDAIHRYRDAISKAEGA